MNKTSFTLCLALIITGGSVSVQAKPIKVITYFTEWGIGHHPPYYVKDMVTHGAAGKLTDLIYAFSEPAPDSTGEIVPKFMNAYEAYQRIYAAAASVDGVADDSTQPLRGAFNQLRELKERYPNLKVLISIGGWTGSGYFSVALETDSSREKFADAIINRYILGNLPKVGTAGGKGVAAGIFDGVDIDWEYPVMGGNAGNHHNPEDARHLTEFLALMRAKLHSINPHLLLTAAIPATETTLGNYQINRDQKYVDWYNVMTYDFTSVWSPITGHHANLLAPADNPSANSFNRAVKYLLDTLKVRAGKIAPGVAFYGRGWKDVAPRNYGLYQPAGGAAPGPYGAGITNYCGLMPLLKEGYGCHWDPSAMAPWLYSPVQRIFWSFDDAKSISLKYHYVVAYHLGGIMCWEIGGDDSSGTLIRAMSSGKMPQVTGAYHGKDEDGPAEVTLSIACDSRTIAPASNVILNTRISGSEGTIVKMEFLVDGRSIGYDTQAPFDWVWFDTPVGKHVIKALAVDREGNQTSSNIVSVIVKSKH